MSNSIAFSCDFNKYKCALFLCDMQEKFRQSILNFNGITDICKRLLTVATVLDIPLIVTEQYPKGLGSTINELDITNAKLKIEKTCFSMMVDDVHNYLKKNEDIKIILLCGIESHVCILQTTLDLIRAGYCVMVISDGVSSRNETERHYAFEIMRQAGAIITTSEICLFQLIRDKNHSHFKTIQNLIKNVSSTSTNIPSLPMNKL
ncbi:unnamed protein product [Didymodactylos carnosus]|uniref:Isochorismatase-like domain-containing protein n=1 Tax=Didymodactylos carnosus TaxID=1234261 RepID=A0A813NDC0_9BILA|nr:unnamed protein product [Didymodactylos carnosus]CAF1148959.1 unnamed protein product [Didymodactylos carnosus]CAF3514428.1 unnamed protein product [Didymodactylos carnosus]CAF3953306.1 unnamed protein product [Didymodactylos carnosus]